MSSHGCFHNVDRRSDNFFNDDPQLMRSVRILGYAVIWKEVRIEDIRFRKCIKWNQNIKKKVSACSTNTGRQEAYKTSRDLHKT